MELLPIPSLPHLNLIMARAGQRQNLASCGIIRELAIPQLSEEERFQNTVFLVSADWPISWSNLFAGTKNISRNT